MSAANHVRKMSPSSAASSASFASSWLDRALLRFGLMFEDPADEDAFLLHFTFNGPNVYIYKMVHICVMLSNTVNWYFLYGGSTDAMPARARTVYNVTIGINALIFLAACGGYTVTRISKQTLFCRRVHLMTAFASATLFVLGTYLLAFALQVDADARCDETCTASMLAVTADTPCPMLRKGTHIAHMAIYIPLLFSTMIACILIPVLQCRLCLLCGAIVGSTGTGMWLYVLNTSDVSWATVYGPFALWCSILMCIANSLATERNARRAYSSAHAQERFTASVSHELRTPLNAIIGNTHIMGRMMEDDKLDKNSMRTILSRLDVSSSLLMLLVNDILDYSSIKAGQFALSSSACDIRALLNGAVDLLRQHAEAKGLQLRVLIDTKVPDAIISDPGRMQQVVVNLLSNAVRYTMHGHIEISAKVVLPPLPSPQMRKRAIVAPAPSNKNDMGALRITVSDTGMGIPPGDIHRIFRFGARGVHAVASKVEGMNGCGFGLAICRQIVRRLSDGMSIIDVVSEEGVGSQFSFAIPCMPTDDVPMANTNPGYSPKDACRELGTPVLPTRSLGLQNPPHEAPPKVAPRSSDFLQSLLGSSPPPPATDQLRALTRGKAVLVVDDNPFNCDVLTQMLADETDVLCSRALSAEEALLCIAKREQSGQKEFDLILMDVQMPITNGFECTRKIRERCMTMPIIGITAGNLQMLQDKSKASGMDALIGKPVRCHQLVAMVSALFKTRSSIAVWDDNE